MARMTSFVRAPQHLDALPPLDLSDEQRRVVHMAVSLLLTYPEAEGQAARLAAVEQSLASLPEAAAAPLAEFIRTSRERGERAMAEHYVDVFDRRRRCSLYLTYYAVGDTRQRGAALVAFKQAMAAVGYELERDELPDYLPAVLELSARSGDEISQALLTAHREGIEVLRAALAAVDSPYARLIDAVSMTMPAMDEQTIERIQALVTAGPPTETVGVTEVLPFPTTAIPPSLQQYQSEGVLGVPRSQEAQS